MYFKNCLDRGGALKKLKNTIFQNLKVDKTDNFLRYFHNFFASGLKNYQLNISNLRNIIFNFWGSPLIQNILKYIF